MKKVAKVGALAACAALAGGALLMTGCTLDENITLNAKYLTGTVEANGQFSNAEEAAYNASEDNENVSAETFLKAFDFDIEDTADGKSIYFCKSMGNSDSWAKQDILVTKNKIVMNADRENEEMAGMTVDETASVTIKDGTIYETNGTIDAESPNKVNVKLGSGIIYVLLNENADNATVTFTRANNAITRIRQVHADSLYGVVTSMTLNGKDVEIDYTGISENSGYSDYINGKYVTFYTDDTVYLEYNDVEMNKQGKNTISATLQNGVTKTINVYYDSYKPITNVKAGAKYAKGKKVTFQDYLGKLSYRSGLKTHTLDGKTVASGVKVWKKGTHTLKLVDKAGNTRTVKFTIK